jgi:hypothetical protein
VLDLKKLAHGAINSRCSFDVMGHTLGPCSTWPALEIARLLVTLPHRLAWQFELDLHFSPSLECPGVKAEWTRVFAH